MKTNKFIEKYMRFHNDKWENHNNIKSLKRDFNGLIVEPDHFNYFYFRFRIHGEKITLTIDRIQELIKWLNEIIENLDPEEMWEINEEMNKRNFEEE